MDRFSGFDFVLWARVSKSYEFKFRSMSVSILPSLCVYLGWFARSLKILCADLYIFHFHVLATAEATKNTQKLSRDKLN